MGNNLIYKNVSIIGRDHTGRGIARQDNKIIFVDYALNHENCDICITKESKSYLNASILKLNTKSEGRRNVPCPYYMECGGCDIQHENYNEQLKFKVNKIEDILKRFAHIDFKVKEVITSNEFNYRNKITLHKLGLYKRNSNEVVDINKCLLVHPKINEIITRLRKVFDKEKIVSATIKVSNLDEVLIAVVGNIDEDILLTEFSDIKVITLNQRVLTKNNYIIDKLLGYKFAISPSSFYQVNRFATEKLYSEIIEVFKKHKYNYVLDLYCGTGTIGILLSSLVQKVIGIEVVNDAYLDALRNKELNKIENIEFICGKVEDNIDKFKNVDVVIVDPPRRGLDKKTKDVILSIKPLKIIYTSCDAITLARDIAFFKEKYDIENIKIIDMFPNTHHVECVSLLSLKSVEK